MHHWLRSFHIISTVGGGFTGLALGLATLLNSWSQLELLAILLVLAFGALCVWAISLGLRLANRTDVRHELLFFYVLQIPHFTTPVLAFHAGFGLMLYVGILPDGQNLRAQLGTDWSAAIVGEQRWLLAINIVPVVVLWLLRRSAQPLEGNS
jgi:hypothetical protein